MCVRFGSSLAIFLRLTKCPDYRQSHKDKPRRCFSERGRDNRHDVACLPCHDCTHGFRQTQRTYEYILCLSCVRASHHILAIYLSTNRRFGLPGATRRPHPLPGSPSRTRSLRTPPAHATTTTTTTTTKRGQQPLSPPTPPRPDRAPCRADHQCLRIPLSVLRRFARK